jgi:hypothetical protein
MPPCLGTPSSTFSTGREPIRRADAIPGYRHPPLQHLLIGHRPAMTSMRDEQPRTSPPGILHATPTAVHTAPRRSPARPGRKHGSQPELTLRCRRLFLLVPAHIEDRRWRRATQPARAGGYAPTAHGREMRDAAGSRSASCPDVVTRSWHRRCFTKRLRRDAARFRGSFTRFEQILLRYKLISKGDKQP